MNKIITAAATAATLMALPAAALASPMISNDFEVTVEHEDLDLTTGEGVSRLDERVRTRIRQHCRTGGRDSASQRLERECQVGALAYAEMQVRIAVAEANTDRARLAKNSQARGTTTPGA
jgi:UrcA family protein